MSSSGRLGSGVSVHRYDVPKLMAWGRIQDSHLTFWVEMRSAALAVCW